jgi:hypothetical protein
MVEPAGSEMLDVVDVEALKIQSEPVLLVRSDVE